MNEKIKSFFEQYAADFSRLDIKSQTEYFAETFISAGPKGVIAQSRQEFAKMAEKMAEYYRSVGQQSTEILSLDEFKISNEYSLIKVHWGAKFKKTGEKLIEFDVSYLIQTNLDKPKIILFISHEDEEEAMKKLGIT